jgi:DNA-binding transcriptional LysR family regulator
MDLKRLRYFVTVARLRSFTHAAEALRIAQPPLSRRIQELEEELGVLLIDRDSRPLTLTDSGRLLFDQAVALLERTEAMVASVHRLNAGEQRRFVFGVIPASFHSNVSAIIRRFALAQPQLDMGIVELNSVQQIAALREGRINAGFSRVMGMEAEGIQRVVMRDEPFVVAVPGDHALAELETPLSLATLAEGPFIIYLSSPRPSLADVILDAFAERGLQLAQKIEVELYETALMMVAAGLGVTLVPAGARANPTRGVAFRPLIEPVVTPIVLCQRDDENSVSDRVLRRILGEYLADQGYPVPPELGPGA